MIIVISDYSIRYENIDYIEWWNKLQFLHNFFSQTLDRLEEKKIICDTINNLLFVRCSGYDEIYISYLLYYLGKSVEVASILM